jgi:hypothetical protein
MAEPEITTMLDGGDPDPPLLRRLAPALDLHQNDLFIIAGLPVPEDLAPLDAAAADAIGSLAWPLTNLPRAVPELHEFVRSLPQLPRAPGAPPPTPPYQRYPNIAGSLVLRLLHNRNLGWPSSARDLLGLGRGSLLAASTVRGSVAAGQP